MLRNLLCEGLRGDLSEWIPSLEHRSWSRVDGRSLRERLSVTTVVGRGFDLAHRRHRGPAQVQVLCSLSGLGMLGLNRRTDLKRRSSHSPGHNCPLVPNSPREEKSWFLRLHQSAWRLSPPRLALLRRGVGLRAPQGLRLTLVAAAVLLINLCSSVAFSEKSTLATLPCCIFFFSIHHAIAV